LKSLTYKQNKSFSVCIQAGSANFLLSAFFTRGGNTQFLSNNLKLRRRVYAGNFQEAPHKKKLN